MWDFCIAKEEKERDFEEELSDYVNFWKEK